jgi:3-dehydroquinate dehydratase-1
MAQLVSSKNLLLSARPLVVGVPAGMEALRGFVAEGRESQVAQCDVLELRLDLLKVGAEELLGLLEGVETPLLVTARHGAEGGEGNLSAGARWALVEPFLGRAALWDVELRSLGEMREGVRQAQAAGVGVIGSFHDFERTPSAEVLEGAAGMAEATGLAAVKVATFLQGAEDLATLVRFAGKERRARVSVMGMGALGPVSRLALAKCGSVLNYGFLGANGNAPGQWPARRLKAVLAEL